MARVTAQISNGTRKEGEASTVGELKAKLNVMGHTAVVNGDTQDDDFKLSDNDFVSLAQPVKAG